MEVIVLDLKNWKKAFLVITISLAALAAALIAVQTALLAIDVNTVPQAFQGVVVLIRNVFGGGVFAIGLIWLRNSWGYIEAYARKKVEGEVQLEYDVNKFYKTTAYYMGNIAIIFNIAPTPELRAIGTAIVFFIDILASTLGKIFAK
jgi:hypothetical protein